MKRILFSVISSLALASGAYAATGDTTIVQAHPQTSFLQYGNYDQPVTFPAGTTSYRKINMTFTLGKETCPSTEQYCAQWDYTIRITVMTPTDTFELGRFITPYAHSSYPNMPLSWKHDYVFDVTDFYPILKNNATMRIKYEGYSWGFTGSLKFDFVEGTPPRDVVGVKKMWNNSFAFGQTANPINDRTAPITFTKPTDAVYAEAYHIISGHGSDDQQNNCAEFCSKWYRWMVNGTNVEQRDIWRNDCGVNWVYPQSGTWVYNRANWCPGDIVFPIVHKVPATALAATTFNAGLEFEAYTSSNQSNPPSYTTSNTLFFYKEYNHLTDAGIEDIIAPSNKDLYFRSNPICSEVKVKVKNYGKNPLTSIDFSYGVVGEPNATHTWTGNIGPMETAIISLPTIASFKTITGNHEFAAVITGTNGTADQESHNDTARSNFTAPPHWDKGNFIIRMVSSSFTQPGNASKWIIRDEAGNIVFQKSSTVASQINTDTLHLENGCYSMEVIAEAGYGFRFLSAFTPGSISVRPYDNTTPFSLPKYNPGNANLAGDFGSGFIQEFVVTNSEPLPVGISKWNNNIQMSISPNPAQSQLTVKLEGINDPLAKIHIKNILGQTVLETKAGQTENIINISHLPAGVYTLIYESNRGSKLEKVVISK